MKSLSIDMAIRVLDESLGQKVLIKLKGGKVIRVILQGFDQHMTLLLKESEEIIGDVTKNWVTLVVRGDNVVIISPPPS